VNGRDVDVQIHGAFGQFKTEQTVPGKEGSQLSHIASRKVRADALKFGPRLFQRVTE